MGMSHTRMIQDLIQNQPPLSKLNPLPVRLNHKSQTDQLRALKKRLHHLMLGQSSLERWDHRSKILRLSKVVAERTLKIAKELRVNDQVLKISKLSSSSPWRVVIEMLKLTINWTLESKYRQASRKKEIASMLIRIQMVRISLCILWQLLVEWRECQRRLINNCRMRYQS